MDDIGWNAIQFDSCSKKRIDQFLRRPVMVQKSCIKKIFVLNNKMSDIKTVSISQSATLGEGGKKKRKTAKKNQAGGTHVTLVPGVESSSVASTAASSNSNTWLRYPADAPVPPRSIVAPSYVPAKPEQAAAPTNQYAVQQGGTKQIKVELKKKSSAKKVHLQPKKAEAPKVPSKKHLTRKIRKVTLGVSSLHKRMTRAKKLHKHIKDMPMHTLKEKLIKNGLIKSTSKAPDSVLRQIASDAEVVAKKAL